MNWSQIIIRTALIFLTWPCARAPTYFFADNYFFIENLLSWSQKPSPPFSIVGIDFAGPFTCKRGNPRKSTLIKTYACPFLCFVTKATHIELVSDLTSEAFLAALTRFTARRGCPSTILSVMVPIL